MPCRLFGIEETEVLLLRVPFQIPTQVHVTLCLWIWMTETNQHLHSFVAHLFLGIQVLFVRCN